MSPTPIPIADLHCDLLDYLNNGPERSPYDPPPRCSIPQLRAGNVALQVLAMFGVTGDLSSRIGLSQSRIFRGLMDEHADAFVTAHSLDEVHAVPPGKTGVIAAIENASVFCSESEPLDDGLARFEEIEFRVGRLLYVAMTWNHENRFGGGNRSSVGLKDDGRTLLEYLSGRRIALDFSHMCPRLAREALELIDARGLDLPVLASHSCFAALRESDRNLPDDVAREIIARGGVIGLNFLRIFLGDPPGSFAAQVRHALELGGAKSYCFGADFFTVEDLDPVHRREAPDGLFFPGFEDSSCYPRLLAQLEKEVPCSEELLLDLAHRNLHGFLERLG